jgi:Prokaryotic RING finger family 1
MTGAPSKKNKICPTCSQKISHFSNNQTCPYCGTVYHKECLDSRATRISGKAAVLLFPMQHDKILLRARMFKEQHLPSSDQRVYNEGRAKIATLSESELLQDFKDKVCPLCAEIMMGMAPRTGKNLELARRFEDASIIYDDLGMFEDAGRIRGLMSKPSAPVERERVEKEKIVERQIVKVKCRFCGALNDDVRRTCESCGANL